MRARSPAGASRRRTPDAVSPVPRWRSRHPADGEGGDGQDGQGRARDPHASSDAERPRPSRPCGHHAACAPRSQTLAHRTRLVIGAPRDLTSLSPQRLLQRVPREQRARAAERVAAGVGEGEGVAEPVLRAGPELVGADQRAQLDDEHRRLRGRPPSTSSASIDADACETVHPRPCQRTATRSAGSTAAPASTAGCAGSTASTRRSTTSPHVAFRCSDVPRTTPTAGVAASGSATNRPGAEAARSAASLPIRRRAWSAMSADAICRSSVIARPRTPAPRAGWPPHPAGRSPDPASRPRAAPASSRRRAPPRARGPGGRRSRRRPHGLSTTRPPGVQVRGQKDPGTLVVWNVGASTACCGENPPTIVRSR